MAEHLSTIQLVGYGTKTLDAEELLAVDRHLASCDVCHDRLMQLSPKTPDPSYDLSIEEPFHLDYDEHLAPYVDGTANEIDREIVESHIALCSQCEEELRDLQEFRQEPVASSLQTDRDVRPSRLKPWMGQWPRLWNPQLTAALVIAIFILGITATFLLWTRNRTAVHEARSTSPAGVDKQTGEGSTSTTPSPEQLAIQPSPEVRENQQDRRDEALIALNDGGQQITLDERGHSTGLESLPQDLRRTVENVLANRRFRTSPALGLSESIARLRGRLEQQDTIVPLAPVGVVIESDRPTFRWRALEGASDYVVTVHDSKLRTIESSGPLSGTEWSIQKPLERGVTYSWQIRAVKDGKTVISTKPPAPEARFRVLDQRAFAAIENARRVQGNSHLVMGVLYWKHGLIDAAEREVEALVRANPDSRVAADLLRSLRALQR